jgi:hypothetical protein
MEGSEIDQSGHVSKDFGLGPAPIWAAVRILQNACASEALSENPCLQYCEKKTVFRLVIFEIDTWRISKCKQTSYWAW